MSIKLVTDKCIIRPFKKEDADSITFNANDKEVAAYMRDSFPHPYTKEDALQFLSDIMSKDAAVQAFAIEVDGQAIGSIGYIPKDNVYRLNAEIGYWIGKKYWGKGIATSAVKALTDYLFQHENFIRLSMEIFSPNKASMQVAEKAGYVLEAVFKKNVFKNGMLMDSYIYSVIKPKYKE